MQARLTAALVLAAAFTPTLFRDWPARPIRVIDPMGGTSEQSAAQIRADLARWGNVIKTAGVKLE